MAPASPITTITTLLRQSAAVSPSDRFRGGKFVARRDWPLRQTEIPNQCSPNQKSFSTRRSAVEASARSLPGGLLHQGPHAGAQPRNAVDDSSATTHRPTTAAS